MSTSLEQQAELESYYLEANQEINPVFDATTSDGIEDEDELS